MHGRKYVTKLSDNMSCLLKYVNWGNLRHSLKNELMFLNFFFSFWSEIIHRTYRAHLESKKPNSSATDSKMTNFYSALKKFNIIVTQFINFFFIIYIVEGECLKI